MNRLLTCTAVGLFLGLTPALAESENTTQAPPAMEDPAMPAEIMPSEPSDPSAADPASPSDPAAPIPGQSSAAPDATSPDAGASPQSSQAAPDGVSPDAAPPQSTEAAPDPASPPSSSPPPQSSEAAPDPASPPSPQTSEAPKSIEPAAAEGAQFLNRQEPSDLLASNLIGKSVTNANDEAIGNVNDLVTDENGKIVGVLIGAGGFLGLGEKDVAVRFEDLNLARDENNNIDITLDMTADKLAAAPDYERLDEQSVTVGETNDGAGTMGKETPATGQ